MLNRFSGKRRATATGAADHCGFRLAAVAAVLLAVAADASAVLDDRLELFVSETVTSDSNVFRLSRDQDPQAILGTSHKSDVLTTTAAGFRLDTPISRQRIQAGFTADHVHYRRFSDLDNTGHDGYATWLWQAGNDLNGQLGYVQSRHLASFLELQGTSANPLTARRLYGNAVYRLTPSWELLGGVAEDTRRNGNTTFQVNDVDIRNVEGGINYVSTASNRLGLSLRQQDARYQRPAIVAGSAVDNDYQQRSAGLVADWNITGKSHLNFRVDRVSRDFDRPDRDTYTGTMFRAAYDLKATGKFSLLAVAQRDLSTTEELTTNQVLVKGVTLSPTLEMSEKLKLSGMLDYSNREYLGSGELAGGTVQTRIDNVRTMGANLSYKPMRSLTLSLTGQYQLRTSNIPLRDSRDTLIGINARFAF